MPEPPTPRRGSPLLPFLVALVPFALLVARFDFLVDDAFISWRYARNLASGAGLVFNPGEDPPVEGFTNLAWVLWVALLERLGAAPESWTRATSALAGVALLWTFVGCVRARLSAGFAGAAASGLFLATLPQLAVWSTGGLETMPFTLALFATWAALVGDPSRPRPALASLAAAATLTLRADGFCWLGMVGVSTLVAWRRTRDPALGRALKVTAAAAAVVLVAVFAWRYASYGEWMPNTARAKVHLGALSLERGARYVVALLVSTLSIPLVLAAALRARDPLAREAWVVVLGAFAYMVVIGGDWMMFHRMLVPALPFVALLFAARFARGLVLPVAAAAPLCALSLLPGWNVHLLPESVRAAGHFRWGHPEMLTEYEVWHKGVVDIEEWILRGKAMALFVEPEESIVLGNIGAIPYYSGLVAHDTHGLTNREPFAPIEPGARETPGHDRKVPAETFEKYEPTYWAAKIVPSDDPFQGLPAAWKDPASAAHGRFLFERHPLPAGEGFEPGTELLLVRYRR